MKRKEIADRLGVHITTVNKYLSTEDYHFLKSDKPAEKKEPTDTEKKHLEQIRKIYKKGDTQTILVKKNRTFQSHHEQPFPEIQSERGIRNR